MCPHPDRQSVDYANEYLSNALSIGEQMLRSGAEVSRVEDSIRRICTAYGAPSPRPGGSPGCSST